MTRQFKGDSVQAAPLQFIEEEMPTFSAACRAMNENDGRKSGFFTRLYIGETAPADLRKTLSSPAMDIGHL